MEIQNHPQELEIQEIQNHPHEPEIQEIQNHTQEPERSQIGNTTVGRTCFNAINALTGVGILSIPYALSEGGWLSILILCTIAAVCYYTGILLKRCMDISPNTIRTYPDIGQRAFGNKGRIIISTLMYLELYLAAVEFLILEGDGLHRLYPGVIVNVGGHKLGKQVFVILATLVILPSTWLRDFGMLAYFSVGGLLASVVLLASVLYVGVANGVGFHQRGTLWNMNGLPTAIGMYFFCYGGHSVFPTLYTSMNNRAQFHKVLLVSFIISTATYGSMAMMGYLMFGEELTSQISLNLPTKYWASKLAIYATLINPITKYAIIVAPIIIAMEDRPLFHGAGLVRRILVRSLLVISTLVMALTIPFFGSMMAFIGSFTSTSLSIMFPCLCYMRIHNLYENLKIHNLRKNFSWELLALVVITLLGVVVSLIGTYVSIRDIIKQAL